MDVRKFSQIGYGKRNPLFDAMRVASNIFLSMSSIKNYHAELFDQLNPNKTIGQYMQELNNACTHLENITKISLPIADGFGLIREKLMKFVNGSIREKTIHEKVYKQLEPYFISIFKMEAEIKPIVSKIWQKELTPIEEFDPNKPFKLLVKVVADWRKITSDNVSKYMGERLGVSTSYITNDKVRLFELENSEFGLIYDLKEGLIAAHEEDAYLMEDVWGENLVDSIAAHPTDVMCIYASEKNNVYSEACASKITPPSQAISSDWNYNEVIVNREVSTPVAACYFYHFNPLLSAGIKSAQNLANENGLPLKCIPHCLLDPLPENFDKLTLPMQLLIKSKRLNQFDEIMNTIRLGNYKNFITSVAQYIFNEDVGIMVYGNIQQMLVKIGREVAAGDIKSVEEVKEIAFKHIVRNPDALKLNNYFLPDLKQVLEERQYASKK